VKKGSEEVMLTEVVLFTVAPEVTGYSMKLVLFGIAKPVEPLT
jgi:hypothetical protein